MLRCGSTQNRSTNDSFVFQVPVLRDAAHRRQDPCDGVPLQPTEGNCVSGSAWAERSVSHNNRMAERKPRRLVLEVRARAELLMPRRPDILRPVTLHTTFPEDIRAKIDLRLWSAVEGKVPKGAYQQFLLELVNEHFNSDSLDVSQYCEVSGNPIIRGAADPIAKVRAVLEVVK